ncbi:MAG: hypothetical protein M1820_004074 [Bogoriella megaspora]|nr:MAG: hypothetical protein M1820_004074 [Bogoriella megaspora]
MANKLATVPFKVIGTKVDTQYVDRYAVHDIIKKDKDEIAIIYVVKGNYYKLPGGGIEADEDHATAAKREAMEDIGCEIRLNDKCIAAVEEWRNDLHQVSYCYVGHLVEDTGKTALTHEEKAEGLQYEWSTIYTALSKMKEIQPSSELGRFIKEPLTAERLEQSPFFSIGHGGFTYGVIQELAFAQKVMIYYGNSKHFHQASSIVNAGRVFNETIVAPDGENSESRAYLPLRKAICSGRRFFKTETGLFGIGAGGLQIGGGIRGRWCYEKQKECGAGIEVMYSDNDWPYIRQLSKLMFTP